MSYEVQQHILSGYRTMSRGTLYIGCMSPFVVAGLTLMDTLVGRHDWLLGCLVVRPCLVWRLLATGGMPEFLCYWLHDPGNPSFGASLLWAGPVQKAAGFRGQVSWGWCWPAGIWSWDSGDSRSGSHSLVTSRILTQVFVGLCGFGDWCQPSGIWSLFLMWLTVGLGCSGTFVNLMVGTRLWGC